MNETTHINRIIHRKKFGVNIYPYKWAKYIHSWWNDHWVSQNSVTDIFNIFQEIWLGFKFKCMWGS